MIKKIFNAAMANSLLNELRKKGVEIASGLSSTDIEVIETRLGTTLPPELRVLLKCGVPVDHNGNSEAFPQWHEDPIAELRDTKEFINRAFTFDIANDNYWHPLLGEKPQSIEAAQKQALSAISKWPPLVRIYGHRFMPTEPHGPDNPVFSFVQAGDSVYYGANLQDYLLREFKISDKKIPYDKIKPVPYWSDAFGLS
jgi:hypothetical protein